MAIISIDKFIAELQRTIGDHSDNGMMLEGIIKNRHRYCGIFRTTTFKEKIVQHNSQSREIKFGYFLENIFTEYLERSPRYHNESKHLGRDVDGDILEADQVFFDDDGVVYLIEQKVRDDHDSTKKRGQVANFIKKIASLGYVYPDTPLRAAMWFIDPAERKNHRYYANYLADLEDEIDAEMGVYYGGTLFTNFIDYPEAWEEMCEGLREYRRLRLSAPVAEIPDFDHDKDIYKQLVRISELSPRVFRSMVGAAFFDVKNDYVELVNEIFPERSNLRRAAQNAGYMV